LGGGKIKKTQTEKPQAPGSKLQGSTKIQFLIRELRELTRISTGGNRENREDTPQRGGSLERCCKPVTPPAIVDAEHEDDCICE
jgi:hypothetical protein